MESIESEGKTVAEAVDSALKKLNLRRDQVEVQILQEANPGFMGFGAKPARVKIAEKLWGTKSAPQPAVREPRPAAGPKKQNSAPPPPRPYIPPPQPIPPPASAENASVDPRAACDQGIEKLKGILRLMALSNPSLSADWDSAQERVKIRVEAPDVEKLIGPGGKTLESLQFLLTLILSRSLGAPVAVQVDALGHWEKREKDILSEARRAVDEVKTTGRPFRLSPMEAPMRRLVHKTLASHPDVETASEGEGSWRKIVIRPRKR